MQTILHEKFCSYHYVGMINTDINGRQTLHVGQYSSLEHVAASVSPYMLAPSDVTVNNTKAVTQQPPYIIIYCTNTTHPPKKLH